MADSLRASEKGLDIIDRARRKKGWNKDAPRWIDAACVSRSNLQQFWARKPIRQGNFVAICKAVGIEEWEAIVDDSPGQPTTPHVLFSVYDEETWVGREQLISQLSEKLRGQCRVLVITGITGQGKTALAERLATVELRKYWSQYKYINFDNGVLSQNFATAADDLLKQLGEDVTADERKDAKRLLSSLVQKLRNNPYVVLMDSLEALLLGKVDDDLARNEFQDERWWEFFSRLLAGQNCQSRLIITSQDLPTQFCSCKYQGWAEQKLTGLNNEVEQFELFQKLFQQQGREVEPESEAADYLMRIGQAYEGHPLVLKVIAGEILEQRFNGNVVAYWHRYRQEFEAIEPAIGHQQLQLRVKDRVRKSLKRLLQDVPFAYTLLLRSSVYRRSVPEAFWLEMLWGLTEYEKAAALGTLESRYLAEPVTGASQLLRQHKLIQEVGYELLRKIANQGSEWKDVHASAARMWLTVYEPELDTPNLEKVRGYLEAFHHLCEVEAWEEARNIFSIRRNTPTNEYLPIQLSTWGYYQELTDLYERLLGKLGRDFDAVLLNDLGISFSALGNYPKAIDYYHKSLSIKQDLQNGFADINTISNLGEAYYKLGNYVQALNYYQRSYEIEPNYKILLNMGSAYLALGNPDKAKECFEQTLIEARQNKDDRVIGSASGSLGIILRHQREYEKAIAYIQQSLNIAREIENPFDEGGALGNLSNVYAEQGNYEQATTCQQQRLAIARKIKDRYGEVRALLNLATAYTLQERFDIAIEHQKQSLALARKILDRQGEGQALASLGSSLIQLEEYPEAVEDLQKALEIFREIQYPMGECMTLGNLGDIYDARGNHVKAIKYYHQSLTITQKIQYYRGQEEILRRLIQAHYAIGDIAKAYECVVQLMLLQASKNSS